MSTGTMNFSDDSEDVYPYVQYSLECFERLDRPPFISKKTRLIAAVVQNQVEVIRELLDSPKWYNIIDGWGYSLLQIAILRESMEVFDYMLSIPHFPLEFKNEFGETALMISLTLHVCPYVMMKEHFSAELIRKGACIDYFCFEPTPLHSAVVRGYRRTTELLIERGIDINVRNDDNCTPLELAIISCGDVDIILMLLWAGAQPSIYDFELSVVMPVPNVVHETLFLYTFDKFSNPLLRLDTLVILAYRNKDLFYEVIKHPIRTTVENANQCSIFFILCVLQMRELKFVLERFADEVKETFLTLDDQRLVRSHRMAILENLEILLQSDLGFNCLNAITKLANLLHVDIDLPDICQRYCFFFSYGIKPTVYDLIAVFATYGYCDLFKIILQMDIQHYDVVTEIGISMPILIHNIKIDPARYLSDPTNYCADDVEELMDYFVHPQLIKLHLARVESGEATERKNIPKIPALVEIARNEFRKYFVKIFNLKNSRQFYTLLNRVPIAEPQKKIISFEVKLY